MKKIVYFLLFSIIVSSCNSESEPAGNEMQMPENKSIQYAEEAGANSKCVFEKETYDLGKIQQGEIVKYTMKFKNEGEDMLIIKSARASCGCTVPKWTKEPIAKGGEGQLEVTFDSSGRLGKQQKSVVLITNSVDKTVEVHFVAEVLANN
jgi:hypothetical protein